MDRLGFFKQALSSTMDVAGSLMGIKKASEDVAEAVEEALRGVKADIGLFLPSVDANMYDSASGTLYEISQMGYTTLEVGSYYDGKVYNVGAEKFKEMVRKDSLHVSALRINKPYIKVEASEEQKGDNSNTSLISAQHQEWLQKAVATAKRLGCEYLTMANFPDEAVEEHIQRYAQYYNLIGQMCQQKGLKLCIHPTQEAMREQQGGSIFDKMMPHCNTELVFLAVDTLECVRAKVDVIHLLDNYKNRVPILHIHDYGIVGESEKIDFDSIIGHAENCGTKKIYIEVSNCPLPPMNCLERSIYKVESLTNVRF